MGTQLARKLERQKMADSLSEEQKKKGLDIFHMMHADNSGKVDVDEICIVHDSDRESMLHILDTDGDGEVSTDEWLRYLSVKKKEKGKKKFTFFMNYLEQEIPKNLPKLKEQQAAKKAAASAGSPAPAAASPAPSPGSKDRVLKEDFAKAVAVFDPPNLGLKDTRIKDAFTNLMFAIQDLDAAVGQGTQ